MLSERIKYNFVSYLYSDTSRASNTEDSNLNLSRVSFYFQSGRELLFFKLSAKI